MQHKEAVLLPAGGVVVRQPVSLADRTTRRRFRRGISGGPGLRPESAAISAGIRFATATDRGWTKLGAPITVQKELMRHASIQTTMNIYGKAMTDSKRQAHSKVVEMVLRRSRKRRNPQTARLRLRLLGVNGSL